MQVIFTNRAHHHFAGVNPYAHQQRRIAFCPQRIRIAAHLLLHAQGGIQRALGMIFVGNRRAKQGKDTIAQALAPHSPHSDARRPSSAATQGR